MPAAPVKLITFAISHYCEAARWTLDWHGIAYEEVGWPPGLHRILARRAGAKGNSVPILITPDSIVESTGAIFDWAEAQKSGLRPALPADEAARIEARLNKVVGVHVRRLIYAHVLPGQAHYVKPMLFANTSLLYRIAGHAMWPITKKLIIKGYRTAGNARQESHQILETEFDWLENLLATRGQYFDGKQFSRLDLLAASLLAPLAIPDEMTVYRDMSMPQDLMAIFEAWTNRPAIEWVRSIYREHRH